MYRVGVRPFIPQALLPPAFAHQLPTSYPRLAREAVNTEPPVLPKPSGLVCCLDV